MSAAWVVASVPFWLTGAFCMGAAVWSILQLDTSSKSMTKEDSNYIAGAAVCMGASMVCLPIAAFLVTR